MSAPSEALLQKQAVKNDLISDTVHMIENLTKETAFSLAGELMEAGEFNNFKLGGVLSKIYYEQEWQEGYASFKELLADKFPGVKYRKANYLINIYGSLVASEISWDKVGHLGWTKLKELAGILTKENVDEWVAKAEKMTVLQLIEAIKQAKAFAPEHLESEEQIAKSLTTLTFKVYEDQKDTIRDAIKKAKAETGTEFDNVAIEGICMSYLSGASPAPAAQVPVSDQIKTMGYEEALILVTTIWPELDLTVKIKPVVD